MKKHSYVFVLLLMIFLVISSSTYATSIIISLNEQESETGIRGKVTDEKGDPLAGVAVEAKSPSLVTPVTTVTDETGQFQFKNLPPGTYTLTFTIEGFKRIVKEDIFVAPRTIVNVQPTTMGMMINVKGGTPKVDQESKYIYILTLPENLGLTPITEEEQKEKCEFYYSKKKIFAKHGIARVGNIKKRLNSITEIPYKDKNYISEMRIEENCVYTIRIGEKENRKILLIRVQEILEDKIEFEYYIGIKNGK